MEDPESRLVCFIPTRVESVGLTGEASDRVLFVRTGVGKVKAAAAAENVFDAYPVDEVLVAGFGGGTRPNLGTADLVACNEIIGLCEDCESPPRVSSSPLLLQRALESKMISVAAPALTVNGVVTSPAEKRALGEKYGAAAVEMEGFPILAESKRLDIPALMVRAILDPVGEALPDWTRLLADSKESRRRAWVAYLMTRPTQIASFIRLFERARSCRKSLRRFMERYL
jgi:adenosylhomocysteine nucleosidase